jgi:hypothetical protein
MKKLVAFLTVAGMLTFGVINTVIAQDQTPAQTEQDSNRHHCSGRDTELQQPTPAEGLLLQMKRLLSHSTRF